MTEPNDTRPEPVVDAGKIAGAVAALVTSVGSVLAVFIVTITSEQVNRAAAGSAGAVIAVISLATYLVPIWKARQARAKVTPLADPRDAAGRPLVTVESLRRTGTLPSQQTPGADHAAE